MVPSLIRFILYLNVTCLYILTEAPRTVTSAFGLGMAHIGDVNMDGYQDFAIGAPFEDDYKGSYLLSVIHSSHSIPHIYN